jgi:hypothetical protein
VKIKVKTMLTLSLTSRGLFTENWSWQAKKSILNTTVTFYGGCMKICEDFALNFGDKKLAVAP